MILVVGGSCQGKLDFVKESRKLGGADIADGAECSLDEMFHKRVVNNLHLLVKRLVTGALDYPETPRDTRTDERTCEKCCGKTNAETPRDERPRALFEANIDMLRDKIIISDEVGQGVVPMDNGERMWREASGRVCCMLARNADEVYRVYAGIPMKIKG